MTKEQFRYKWVKPECPIVVLCLKFKPINIQNLIKLHLNWDENLFTILCLQITQKRNESKEQLRKQKMYLQLHLHCEVACAEWIDWYCQMFWKKRYVVKNSLTSGMMKQVVSRGPDSPLCAVFYCHIEITLM